MNINYLRHVDVTHKRPIISKISQVEAEGLSAPHDGAFRSGDRKLIRRRRRSNRKNAFPTIVNNHARTIAQPSIGQLFRLLPFLLSLGT